MNPLTLGSLFSGSGGFELAGKLCGIQPLWASEIEPFPIRVTTKRLPEVRHLGDVRAINGAKIPPVDIISFGSPCTNLSVAGRREGLTGKESSLFYEAIRIIKEMKKETHDNNPRYIIFENVPGLFSSSNREDFRQVLTEIVQIAEPGVPDESADSLGWKTHAKVPACPKDGWPPADVLLGNGWSLAYRTIDAQHFGVPQRRRRIYLVADFMSERAGDILFERQGVRRDFTTGTGAGQGAAVRAEGCAGSTHCGLRCQSSGFSSGHSAKAHGVGFEAEKSPTLRAGAVPATVMALENHPTDSRIKLSGGIVQTLSSRMGTGGGSGPLALCLAGNIIDRSDKNGGNGLGVNEEVSFTLNTADRHAVAFTQEGYKSAGGRFVPARLSVPRDEVCDLHDCAGALSAEPGMKQQTFIMTAGCQTQVCLEQSPTLTARDWKDPPLLGQGYAIRRLTPRECAKLQGFDPDWCAGLETPSPTEEDIAFWAGVFETHRRAVGKAKRPKSRNQIIKWLKNPHSDSAEYKMWGNGICVCCALFVMRGIIEMAREG
ncbi:MAG: DNA cytosine methyltransferase [Oscillospiraceae bacterium]|jgi:DNA (cytosine-5)-methyltransferase 1|nr:DNA cytosine methyltransferase [Oscillospiraceae bacterium]